MSVSVLYPYFFGHFYSFGDTWCSAFCLCNTRE